MNDTTRIARKRQLEQTIANCPTCKGLGRTKLDIADPTDPRFGRLLPCPTCHAETSVLRQIQIMERLQGPISRHTALIGTLLACTFENLHTEQNPQLVAARNAVIRFVREEIPWVYMYGPPGNGKTHLAAAAANHLISQGKAVLFATAPELLAMVRQGFDDGRAEPLIRLCERVPWLVVDDLGAERLNDWAAEVMFRIFNARYSTCIPTLVVSNVCPDDIAELRLRSRFLDTGLCQVVPNGAEDYRQRKRMAQREPVFSDQYPTARRLDPVIAGGNGAGKDTL
jgi:DNA replication protein DnaC